MKLNNDPKSRRTFIKTSAAGTAALTIGITGIGSFLQSCVVAQKNNTSTRNIASIGLEQSPLPYKYDALENIIDAATMEIHYSKHAAGYAKNLKEAIAAEGINSTNTIESILANVSKYTIKMRNNAGGHYNHELFWKSMRPQIPENKPTGKLANAIDKAFGSFASFKTQFGDAGKNRFGSGWAWLYTDDSKNLKIGSTPNQDNPIMDVAEIKGSPLLGLDVWEHAYYLKYQNKRADYIQNWWSVVNWDYVQQRYEIL